jgi:phosphate transport system protein
MKKFEHELASLKTKVLRMGGTAEQMVGWAAEVFRTHDRDVAAKVRDAEETLDQLQVEIDGEAVRLITIYTPTARDLRFLLMVVRIVTEIERIGDQAVNNCEYVETMRDDPPARLTKDVSRMTELVVEMVHGALDAFNHEDPAKATSVLTLDDDVDRLNAQTFRDLVAEPTGGDPDALKQAMNLVLLARSLERIADHATNICEEVVYMVKGEDIRHQESDS